VKIDRFNKTIIFTKIPLTGYFKFYEKFQIYPADLEGMPVSKNQEHYPVILEYVIEKDEIIEPPQNVETLKDLRTYTASTLTKQDEILNLLTLFTNHQFFRYYDLTGNWGMPILKENAGDEANLWSSKWCMTMFHWPNLSEQLKIEKFTDIELKYDPVKFISFKEYYEHNPNYDFYRDQVITFPNNMFLGIEYYYALDIETKKIIDVAISHTVSAMELRQFKKTLSVISAFTSIETMVNFENIEFNPESCDSCGQLKFKVAKKYRDYLLKYIGNNPNNKKKFNALYKLRSKIVHTGMLFKTENLWNDISQEEKDEEFINQLEVILLSKLSVINWLLINNSAQQKI